MMTPTLRVARTAAGFSPSFRRICRASRSRAGMRAFPSRAEPLRVISVLSLPESDNRSTTL
jgi:hypothetical protein